MSVPNQDVTADSSTVTEEQVVNPEVTSDQVTETSDEQTNDSAASSPQNENVIQDELDESGVPYKNRFMEYKRKYEDLSTKQDAILSKLDSLSNKEQSKEYSEDQLRQFIATTDNPYHKDWALKELDALKEKKIASTVRSELEKFQRSQSDALLRQQIAQDVLSRYQDATIKDAQGKPVGFNPSHPLTQRINFYLQDPELANNPKGLMVAAALAYSDVGMTQSGKTQTKLQQVKRENKVLQNKTLTEGAGRQQPVQKTPVQVSVEQARSGSMKDAQAAMKEIFKARGVIKSED